MKKNFLNMLPLVVFLALVISFATILLRPEKIEMMSKPMPPLTLKGLKTEDIKGPALINFFASWCTPCHAEHDNLMALSEKHKLPIYGIAYKDKRKDTDRYLKELGNPYKKIGRDDKGRAFIDWGLSGVPETFLIDADNMIRYHHAGVLLEEDVSATIMPIIQELETTDEN
ncbi:MAG: thiol:disulfide interchange protein [Micavibrio sp.]|nr:MAG: thiol:disulfide interchange protein [Micavibrio sp.]